MSTGEGGGRGGEGLRWPLQGPTLALSNLGLAEDHLCVTLAALRSTCFSASRTCVRQGTGAARALAAGALPAPSPQGAAQLWPPERGAVSNGRRGHRRASPAGFALGLFHLGSQG